MKYISITKKKTLYRIMSCLIVIPFRKREEQLRQYLKEVLPLFMKHLNKFKVVVMEQGDDKPFNRGALMNIAFKEYKNKYDYLITNDVDILPTEETVKKYYTMKKDVVRIYCAHQESCGGICKIKSNVFSRCNGFPSDIWGWGVEDRSLYFRLRTFNILVGDVIYPPVKLLGNPEDENTKQIKKLFINHRRRQIENQMFRRANLEKRKTFYYKSGLNSLQYTIIQKKEIHKHVDLIKIIF